ncbi:adenosylcobinamide-GDP ribazoletransferase [Marinomonas agarivorans]|nr:adenosylcobinamide-GDP ribazoletransferase [Marinomonas agarivorans]
MFFTHIAWLLEGLKRSLTTYTRLPIPIVWCTEKQSAQPAAFLPLVGILVAFLSAWPIFVPAFDVSLTALFMLLTAVLLTGAFHEDGFMDATDGLVGGMNPEQRLTIMKDSRLGSYAAIGIWFLLALKWLLLSKLLTLSDNAYAIVVCWLATHILARVTPLLIMHRLPYVSLGNSKAAPMIGRFKRVEWLIVILPVFALIGAFHAIGLVWYNIAFLIGGVCFTALCLGYYCYRKIAGFNGDTLGASEQCSEVLMLFLIVLFFSF